MAFALMGTYSFEDVQGSVQGPGMSFSIGQDVGIGEGGIAVRKEGDKDIMKRGADGSGMHSLVAFEGGQVSITCLKTSPLNAALSQAYNFQKLSSANWGQNTIVFQNLVTGDTWDCSGGAFRKMPDNVNDIPGPDIEWTFNCVRIDSVLGTGSPVAPGNQIGL